MINYSIDTQSEMYFYQSKINIYKKAKELSSKEPNWMRTAGPIIAFSSGVLTVAISVAKVVESLFKGLANLLGFPFVKKYKLLTGLHQIFILTPKNLWYLFFSPLVAVAGGLITVCNMAYDPLVYSSYREERNQSILEELQNRV